MNRIVAHIILTATVFASTGCAFTNATLELEYAPDEIRRGPLSEIEPSTWSIGLLVDQRPDTTRVGFKRNGFGAETADLLPPRPVEEIVADALAAALRSNHHVIDPPAGRFVLDGEITQYWFDLQVGLVTLEFMGSVDVTLYINDGMTGAVLHKGTYSGHYNEKAAAGYTGTYGKVLNLALQRMIEEFIYDPEVAAAISKELTVNEASATSR